MKSLKYFVPCVVLATIFLATFIEASYYRHRHHRCNLDDSNCAPFKVLNIERCACKCPDGYSKDDCYKNEIWDDELCTCYCPHHAPFSNPNPVNMYWSRSSCKYKCIKKLTCKFGEWNSKNCSCPLPLTTTTISTTTTQSINDQLQAIKNDFSTIQANISASISSAISSLQNYSKNTNLTVEDLQAVQDAIAFIQSLNISTNSFLNRRKRQTKVNCADINQQIINAEQNLMLYEYNALITKARLNAQINQNNPNSQYIASIFNSLSKTFTDAINSQSNTITNLQSTAKTNNCSVCLLNSIPYGMQAAVFSNSAQSGSKSCPYSWNSYFGNNEYPKDALYAGKNQYCHDIFVGAGVAPNDNDLVPANLDPIYVNGVTVESYYVVTNVTTGVTYLAIPSTCNCFWVPTGNFYSMPGLVMLQNHYWIGRYTFSDGTVAVGKIYDQSGNNFIMSYVNNNQEIQTKPTNVLQCICQVNSIPAGAQTASDNTQVHSSSSSGQSSQNTCSYSWKAYSGDHVPPSDALYVGKNQYCRDIYVGAGTAPNDSDLVPADLDPVSVNGVTVESYYVITNVTTSVTYLAIPSTCKCFWLPTGNFYSMPGLVMLRNHYWIGRYTFSDGTVTVGKIYDQGGNNFIMSLVNNNQEIQVSPTKVLQCI